MILEVCSVSRSFGGLRALSSVDLRLERGTILGLMGPNGAGKTTLFNVINGVVPPDSGTVRFLGRDVTGWRPHLLARMGMSRAHQIVRPLRELTVRANCMAGACFGGEGLSMSLAGAVADEVLERMGLADRAEELAGGLNVAQKKRLEMARALAARPQLLLLDEVLAGLNPTEVEGMVGAIRAIRERGVTIVMIEHVMRAMMSVSDRIVVLHQGSVLADGAPGDVVRDVRVIEAYLGDPRRATRGCTGTGQG